MTYSSSSLYVSSASTATATAPAQTSFSRLNCKCKQPPSSRIRLHLLSRSSPPPSISFTFNPLRSLIGRDGMGNVANSKLRNQSAGFRAFCYSHAFAPSNLQWISAVSSLVLILARGTAVPKQFIVPLFALQAPVSVVAWIKGRYGLWSAFLALLVRLFYYIPGELELPFLALLLVIVAPNEAIRLRGTKEGALISLVIAVYLAFQHFSRTSLQKSFDQGSIVATIAVICITVASLLLLI